MSMLKKRSMDRWFRYLVWFSVLVFAVVFCAGMFILNHMAEIDGQETLDTINQQIITLNRQVLDKAEAVAQRICFSNVTREYLCCKDEFQLISRKKQLDDVVIPMIDADEQLGNVILYRATHRTPYSAKGLDIAAFYDFARQQEYEETARTGFDVVRQESENGTSVYSYPIYSMEVVNTRPGVGFGEFLGTLTVVLNRDYLNMIIRSVDSSVVQKIYVVDDTAEEVMACTGGVVGVDMEVLYGDRDTFWQKIRHTDWSIGCTIDRRRITLRYTPFFLCLIIFAALVITILFLIYHAIRRYFTIPMSSLVKEVDLIAQKAGPARLSDYGTKDIDRIVRHLNSLLNQRDLQSAKMLQMEKRQYEIEVDKKINDLYVLENQISPHFLLNTLTCIGGMAMVHHVPEIARLVSDVSSICHYSIRKADTVTMREEVDNIRRFFSIVDARTPHSYLMTVDVPPEALQCAVPKMTLQPLIENAIYHGLEQQGSGTLVISAFVEGGTLRISICDNGVGIPAEQVRHMQEQFDSASQMEYLSVFKKKVGVINLCRRIKLIYGDDYGLRIESQIGVGTTLEVILPLITDAAPKPEEGARA